MKSPETVLLNGFDSSLEIVEHNKVISPSPEKGNYFFLNAIT